MLPRVRHILLRTYSLLLVLRFPWLSCITLSAVRLGRLEYHCLRLVHLDANPHITNPHITSLIVIHVSSITSVGGSWNLMDGLPDGHMFILHSGKVFFCLLGMCFYLHCIISLFQCLLSVTYFSALLVGLLGVFTLIRYSTYFCFPYSGIYRTLC
jgi:hypothetical protein